LEEIRVKAHLSTVEDDGVIVVHRERIIQLHELLSHVHRVCREPAAPLATLVAESLYKHNGDVTPPYDSSWASQWVARCGLEIWMVKYLRVVLSGEGCYGVYIRIRTSDEYGCIREQGGRRIV
jgi:hypothetical protein